MTPFLFHPSLSSALLSLYFAESGTVNILGGNQQVVQDQQVEFQCVTTAWFPVAEVSWTRNGQAVNMSLYNTSSVAHGNWFNSTSVLKFQAVSNTTVECLATIPALTHPKSSSVYLVVGKRVFILSAFCISVCLPLWNHQNVYPEHCAHSSPASWLDRPDSCGCVHWRFCSAGFAHHWNHFLLQTAERKR